MKTIFEKKEWNWFIGGIILGLIFIVAVVLVKPIGVSTQFVIFDGVIWNTFQEVAHEDIGTKTGYSSFNAYIAKSGGKYAESIANPLNYSFVFVIAMLVGGYVAKKLGNKKGEEKEIYLPKAWSNKYGNSHKKRYTASFIGGILVLLGARIAGGCTSGHMMSGMMQTSVSGYIFTLGVFIVAIPVAIILYKGD